MICPEGASEGRRQLRSSNGEQAPTGHQERELAQCEVVDATSDALFVHDETGRILDVNERMCAMYGYDRESALALRMQDVSQGEPPYSQAEAQGHIARAVRDGRHEFEWRGRRSTGELFWAEVSLRAAFVRGERRVVASVRDITERKQAEEALRASELRFRTLFESANDGVIILDDGRFALCNQRALELFGCTREEFLGKRPADFSPPRQPDGSESHERARELSDAALAGQPQSFEWLHCRRDGTPFYAEVGLNAVEIAGRRQLQAIVRNITQRKKADAELRASQEKYTKLFHATPDAVLVTEITSGTIVEVNKSFEEFSGFSRDELLGRPVLDFDMYSATERERFVSLLREHGGMRNEEFSMTTRAGSKRTVLASAEVITINEEVGALTILRDITESKAAREQASRNQQALIQADKMASLGIMVAGVAHEINNPTSLIMLNADVLKTFWLALRPAVDAAAASGGPTHVAGLPYATVAEKFGTLVDGISSGSQRIAAIVKHLKDFSRFDAAEMAGRANVREAVDVSVTLMGNLLGKSTRHLHVIHGDGLPLVRGSIQKLEQVIVNLITNACHALPNPDCAISIRSRCLPDRDAVTIEVHDEGVGIAPDDLSRIFDPFFTTKRDAGGTGLGLSVAYAIVKKLGGDLTFESELGKGTTAIVSLPAIATDNMGARA
jgi:PAS domain S-box-containing protein